MSNIVDKIKSIKDVSAIKGCTTAQIREAQESLDLVFPDEYIEYVKAFGCIDFGSTEWTGLPQLSRRRMSIMLFLRKVLFLKI